MLYINYKKNILLAILAACLVCAGAGSALASSQPEKAPKEEAASKGDKKADKGGDQDITGGKFDGDPIYVHIKPVHITVIDDYGVDQIVSISIDLAVKDFTVAQMLVSNMPKVQDAILQAIYGGLGNGSLQRGNTIDFPKTKKYIAYSLQRTFHTAQVDDVLIQALAQRRL